jgi:DNA-binding transcriptional ArsR family regulator
VSNVGTPRGGGAGCRRCCEPMSDTGTSIATLTRSRVRVARSPSATLTQLTMEALGRSKGSPASWPGAVREALQPSDLTTLGPVYGPTGPPFVPDCLLPRPAAHASSFEDELEQIAAVTADDLVADLHADGQLGTPWATVARAPRRWLDAYVQALERAWMALSPLWLRATPLLEREVDRIERALSAGAFDRALDGLHPDGHVIHDRWHIPCQSGPVTIGAELLLVPMLIGPRATLLMGAGGEVTYLAYPLRGAHGLTGAGSSNHASDSSALEALLGAPRANILRSLDRARSAGQIARALHFSPGAVTHHLIALERAGLISREPHGRHVLAHRTPRGTSLLGLYEP